MIRAFSVCVSLVLASQVMAQDVVVIGEVHDNPAHHKAQENIVRGLAPKALVFEMLTSKQAQKVTPDIRSDENALESALNWADSGWPDFSMYFPIFEAAPDARVYGAQVPRERARAAFEEGISRVFSGDAKRFGLTQPLPDEEQSAREAMQKAAHCDALPENLLPMMVDIQRLRDAELAKATETALRETGGPVAVITGNGHARRDWGMPVYLSRAAPKVEIRVIGQAEEGSNLHGRFDEVLASPAVDRPDPCAAFN